MTDKNQKPKKSLMKRFFEALARGEEESEAAMFRQLRGPSVTPCQCKCECKQPKP